MGGFSLVHWIIVLVVILLLFGRGRISEVMGDFGKGIKSFKQGLNEDGSTPAAPSAPPPAQIAAPDANANANAGQQAAETPTTGR